MKKKVWIILIILVILAAGIGWWFYNGGSEGEDTVYVTQVSTITGLSANGLNNRYAGVVEAEESWSATLDENLSVKEVLVSVNQEVEEGTPLFTYDTAEVTDNLNAAKIELERLNNELAAIKTSLDDLAAQRDATTDESAKAEYTVEIRQAQLDVTAKQYDISSKQEEIKKLETTLESATVTSKIAGVVKSIASDSDAVESDGFITIVNLNRFRIRGEVNEQNVASLSEDLPVIVYSRVDDNKYWTGTITKVDTGSGTETDAESIETDSMYVSSSYPFYISVEDSTGLNIGQHVYIELDNGQLEETQGGLLLEEYYIDFSEQAHPHVWVDVNGRIQRREVTLGDYNESTMKYEITGGLSLSDCIAMPYEGMREGTKTTLTDNEEENYAEEGDAWIKEDLDDITDIDSDIDEEDEALFEEIDEALED